MLCFLSFFLRPRLSVSILVCMKGDGSRSADERERGLRVSFSTLQKPNIIWRDESALNFVKKQLYCSRLDDGYRPPGYTWEWEQTGIFIIIDPYTAVIKPVEDLSQSVIQREKIRKALNLAYPTKLKTIHTAVTTERSFFVTKDFFLEPGSCSLEPSMNLLFYFLRSSLVGQHKEVGANKDLAGDIIILNTNLRELFGILIPHMMTVDSNRLSPSSYT